MFEGVVVSALAAAGPWGLVSLFVMLVLFGGLIPRWMHNERVGDLRKQVEYLQLTVEKREQQTETLLRNDELVIRLLEDLKREAAKKA